jgi:hypothetical protein
MAMNGEVVRIQMLLVVATYFGILLAPKKVAESNR